VNFWPKRPLRVTCRLFWLGGAKAISVASSYRDGANRVFLDSPKAEWLWEFAEANDIGP
jgi:hypothetical protein